jgi:hypothetical protein
VGNESKDLIDDSHELAPSTIARHSCDGRFSKFPLSTVHPFEFSDLPKQAARLLANRKTKESTESDPLQLFFPSSSSSFHAASIKASPAEYCFTRDGSP